jgi:hypothetical protein
MHHHLATDTVRAFETWLDMPIDPIMFHTCMCVVYGPSGIGLTTMVKFMLDSRDIRSVWFVPSMSGTACLLKETITSGCGADGKRKAVVLDEFDGFLNPGQTDASCILKAIGDGTSSLPLKIVCIGRTHPAAVKNVTFIEFQAPKVQSIMDIMRQHVESTTGTTTNSPKMTEDTLQTIAHGCRGDLRHALTVVAFGRDEGLRSDFEVEGLDILRVLFSSATTVRDALRLFWMDTSIASAGACENYWMSCPDIQSAATCADTFSQANQVEQFMYQNQQWDVLFETYGVMTAGVVAVGVPRRSGLTLERYGSVWSRLHNGISKQKNIRRVQFRCLEHGVHPYDAPDLAFVRSMLHKHITSQNIEAIRDLGQWLDAAAVLSIMRLSKMYKYDHKLHMKVKQWM